MYQCVLIAVQRRAKAFLQSKAPCSGDLADAWVAQGNSARMRHALLMPGDYGLVIHGGQVFVGRGAYIAKPPLDHTTKLCLPCAVIAVLSRTGGKGVAHAWQHSCVSIGHLSYISVQLFE